MNTKNYRGLGPPAFLSNLLGTPCARAPRGGSAPHTKKLSSDEDSLESLAPPAGEERDAREFWS